jgi:hypothetical protein
MLTSTDRENKANVSGRFVRVLAPLLLAVALFVLNNLAVLSGWLNPPEGYAPTLMVRAQDIAIYLSWANGYLIQNLVPSYAAPWLTEPAFFNTFMWLLAQFSKLTGLGIVVGYHIFHFLFYIAAAYALFFAVRVFTETAKQFWAAFLVILCVVPLPSLAVLPSLLAGKSRPPIGVGYFVWPSSDGFFHGIGGSALVTFGTATTLIAFSLLAKYIKTEQRRYLLYAGLVAFLSALVHATEIFLIVAAGTLTLIWWRGRQWKRAIPDIAVLGLAGAFGLTPYLIMTMRQPWLRDLAHQSRWQLPAEVHEILLILGLPAILVLLLLVMRPRMNSPTDRLLQIWFACTLIGIFLPVIPSPQHLFDGFHYATAILLVRQTSQIPLLARIQNARPRLVLAGSLSICLFSLSAYAAYYRQSFRDGRLPRPEKLFSTVAPKDELGVISWMRQNASPDQLVLAPPANSPWLMMVPMHSFASHWHWGLTFTEQIQLAEDFYKGKLSPDAARQFLTEYGIRYVITPEASPASAYIGEYSKRACFGSLTIYESSTNAMKPYLSHRSKEVLITHR